MRALPSQNLFKTKKIPTHVAELEPRRHTPTPHCNPNPA